MRGTWLVVWPFGLTGNSLPSVRLKLGCLQKCALSSGWYWCLLCTRNALRTVGEVRPETRGVSTDRICPTGFSLSQTITGVDRKCEKEFVFVLIFNELD